MGKMIKATVIIRGKEKVMYLNTDRIISIEPCKQTFDEFGGLKEEICSVDFEPYGETIKVNETARELANRINYLEE